VPWAACGGSGAAPSSRLIRGAPMGRIVVEVMPKPEILDPQGKAVVGSLPPKGLNWRPCFPDMYLVCHAKV